MLLPPLEAKTILADKGYEAEDRVLKPLREAGKEVVIPPKKNRKEQRDYDKELYKARHLVENFFKPGEAAVTLGVGEERREERIPEQLKRFL